MSQERPSGRRIFVILVGVFISGTILSLFFYRRNEQPPVEVALTPQEYRKLAVRHAVAIAHLENKEYLQADKIFTEIKQKLPDNVGVLTNIAIARILPLVDIGTELDPQRAPEKFQTAIESAWESLDELEARASDSALTWLLIGKLSTREKDQNRANLAFDRSTQLAEWDASIWYAAGQSATQFGEAAREREAFSRAYQLKPRNLWLLTTWLQIQASAEDPSIRNTLGASTDVVKPFAEQIRTTINFDVLEAIDQAVNAVETQNWRQVSLQTRLLSNVLKPQIATLIDQRRIDRNLMEFIEHRLNVEGFPTQSDDNASDSEPDVSLTLVDEPLTSSQILDFLLVDFDSDGRTEIIALTEDHLKVLKPSEPSQGWVEIVTCPVDGDFEGLISADLDRDYRVINNNKAIADPDIVLFGSTGMRVLKNEKTADSDVRQLIPMDQTDNFVAQSDVEMATLVDFDHDGDLDIVAAESEGLRLWSNLDNFTFADVTDRSAMPPRIGSVTNLIAVDWNRDVAIDVVIGCSEGVSGILENIFHGRFRFRPLTDDLPESGNAAQIALIDADGNASWDLLEMDSNGIRLELTETPESGVVRSLRSESIDQTATPHVHLSDFDNDGFQDLAASDQEGVRVLWGRPQGRFEPSSAKPLLLANIERLRSGDIDKDGDLDLFALAGGKLRQFTNEGGNLNQSIEITIQADFNPEQFPSQRVNMQGVGSLIEVRTGSRYQARVVDAQSTHFGLGKQDSPDVVRVLWTDGVPHNETNIEPGQPLYAIQVLKGSCPYLYTWTGEQFEFFTDCLWAAPIGLQFAEGALASPREWEYLLIPGPSLKPKGDRYVIQLTEELWEAAYFDQVKLLAIDHPRDVEIHTNEKVGPASLAEYKIHAVRVRQRPLSAIDSRGNDLLAALSQRDRRFAKAFPTRIKQGLTPLHHIELAIEPVQHGDRVTLFLTGWVMPTDTSLNVAISQNPDLESPRPPFISIPNDDGTWKEILPFVGFPGGKTKTIAVELGPYIDKEVSRIRISSSMEIYWDEIFYTVNEPHPEIRRTDLKPVSADLHFRGFSERTAGHDWGPERYDYSKLVRTSPWVPMNGRFTRYGDVTELLLETDRKMVVLGAGDEMTVSFDASGEPPPEGWVRDFLLYNVGWDKDADLNTVFGQTVEPLPHAEMRSYPLPAESDPGNKSQDFRDYLKTFQTREMKRRSFWREVLPKSRL